MKLLLLITPEEGGGKKCEVALTEFTITGHTKFLAHFIYVAL